MPMWRSIVLSVLATATVAFCLPVARGLAQETPAAPALAAPDTAAAAVAAPAEEVARRHPNRFGVSARGTMLVPIHILKENRRSLNDATASGMGFGGGARWYTLDGMAVTVNVLRGGLNYTDDPGTLRDVNADATDLVYPVDGNAFLQLDGVILGVNAHLGKLAGPDSPFYPYLRFCVGYYDWRFARDGRDSDAHLILDQKIEGSDLGAGGGFGTEYKLAPSLLLEAEWTWQYLLTDLGRDETAFTPWANTHFWDVSLGVIWTF